MDFPVTIIIENVSNRSLVVSKKSFFNTPFSRKQNLRPAIDMPSKNISFLLLNTIIADDNNSFTYLSFCIKNQGQYPHRSENYLPTNLEDRTYSDTCSVVAGGGIFDITFYFIPPNNYFSSLIILKKYKCTH